MTGFQTQVNRFPGIGVAGDFASDNPRKAMVAGDSALVATSAGVTLGRFAWANAAGVVSNAKPGSGVARLGFAAREGQPGGFLTTGLVGASMVLNGGNAIVLHEDADVLVDVTVGAATIGLKAFASTTDGSVQPGAAGATISGYVETPWSFLSAAAVGEQAIIGIGS